MVLSTEWSQIEVIDLVNDGSGLGFGIVGGRSTGVVIKSILPGGLADKDTRLQSGDHILQIGDVNLRGLAADQVATVLRQAGSQVRMVVARSVEPNSADFQSFGCSAPIVPTKILTDTDELDRQLQQNGYSPFFCYSTTLSTSQDEEQQEPEEPETIIINKKSPSSIDPDRFVVTNGPILSSQNGDISTHAQTILTPSQLDIEDIDDDDIAVVVTLPETDRFAIDLTKDDQSGLGITIAGYVCEREDLSGIFVKSLSDGSEAYRSGLININDRIVEVDGQSLGGYTNHEAVEKLRGTGRCVRLTLERYLRGPKFEHLQEALGIQQSLEKQSAKDCPVSPSVTTLSWIPIETNDQDQTTRIEPSEDGGGSPSINSEIYEHNLETKEIFIEENFEVNLADDLESTTKKKWESLIGSDADIVVANLTKLKGLGISLEGTVDVEGGIELRPRHFIRSILPEGPVGQNGKLSPGDELLEVNGQRLLGIKHVEVVKLLKELPNTVRLVCARKTEENRVINTSQDREGFEARNILGGSLKNLLPNHNNFCSEQQRLLLKALSDSSINTSVSTVTVTDDQSQNNNNNNNSLQKAKSRSLEVTNFAMWSDDIEFIDLIKCDRGLGFSILDYQDPLDDKSTVIVVRSLVPNGPAEYDGRITPGDRLISVNGKLIKNVTLDQAVQALKGTVPGIVKLGIAKPLTTSSRVSTEQTINSSSSRHTVGS